MEHLDDDLLAGEWLRRLEATPKQCLRIAATEDASTQAEDLSAQANLMLSFVVGRWHQYAKSGFKRKPSEMFDHQWPLLI